MKSALSYLFLIMGSICISQNAPIDFETGGIGAQWTWTVFENDTNPPLEIIGNPDMSGVNTSPTVAKFTTLDTGQPFAGVESMHGSDIGTFTINSTNAFVHIKVWKSVISDVGIKFATPAGGSTGEIKVPNTVINQWEELVFDFTDVIGIPETIDVDQIIIFPDFRDRNEDSISYFDDISFSDGTLSLDDIASTIIQLYPNPVGNTLNIQSIQPISQIEIYTMVGAKVSSNLQTINQSEIDVSFLSSGLYVASITVEGKQELHKVY